MEGLPPSPSQILFSTDVKKRVNKNYIEGKKNKKKHS